MAPSWVIKVDILLYTYIYIYIYICIVSHKAHTLIEIWGAEPVQASVLHVPIMTASVT